MSTLGERIKLGLKEKGWNQTQLAKELGVTPGYVSQWANDRVVPKEEHLMQMEKILGGLRSAAIEVWLRGARMEKGLSPQQLATAANVSLATIYNIEGGRNTSPRPDTIKKLEGALGNLPEKASEQLAKESRIEGLGRMEDFGPSKSNHEEWPKVAGVYVLYDQNERPVYVGQSHNIHNRLMQHALDKDWYASEEIVSTASFIQIDEEKLRRQVESILIKFLKSYILFNKQHKRK